MHRSRLDRTNSSRSGFTLIELLVIIAIIAILAAILFPVFAQAREKARQSSCQSNMKELGLGVLQYVQDNDELYPFGQDFGLPGCPYASAPGGGNCYNSTITPGSPIFGKVIDWAQEIAPYVKPTGIFACPDDTVSYPNAGMPVAGAVSSFYGLGMSYSVNAWQDYVDVSVNNSGNYQPVCFGVMCPLNSGWRMGYSPSTPNTVGAGTSDAKITHPDQTIIAEQYTGDDQNPAAMMSTNGGGNNVSLLQNKSLTTDAYPGCPIPNGTRAATTAQNSWFGAGGNYGTDANGCVSAHHTQTSAGANDGLSNFAFCDGHVKAMHPYLTNPHGIRHGQAASDNSNMWDAYRP